MADVQHIIKLKEGAFEVEVASSSNKAALELLDEAILRFKQGLST